MPYIFTYTPKDKTNLDPAEFIGIIFENNHSVAIKKAEQAMPRKLKELEYKVGICKFEDNKDFVFIVKNNRSYYLNDLSEIPPLNKEVSEK